MWKSLLLWVLLCFLATSYTPAVAANTSDDLGTVPVQIDGRNYDAKVYLVTYDTTGNDLIVATAASSSHSVCSLGFFMSESNAMNFIFKPKTSKSLTLELAANQGIYDKLGHGVAFCTIPGNNFVINSNAAFGGIFYIIQDTRIRL